MAEGAQYFFPFNFAKDLEEEIEPETIDDWFNECINNSKIKWCSREQSVTCHCDENVADGI